MRDWQVNQRAHLCYASEQGLCPKNKNHPIFGWMIIILLWLKLGDVGDLTRDALVFGGYTAISVNGHKNSSKIVLRLTVVSFDAYIMSCFCEKGSHF